MSSKGDSPSFLDESPSFGKINISNVKDVLKTASLMKEHLSAGKLWKKRVPPDGELVIVGAIIFNGKAVSSIEFSPSDGLVLPKGYHPHVFSLSVEYEKIKEYFEKIVYELKLGDGAEYREPESSWEIPLIYRGMVVAHIKVYYDALHILPDFIVDQEMKIYEW